MQIPVMAKFMVEADDEPNALGMFNDVLRRGRASDVADRVSISGLSAGAPERVSAAATNPRAHMRIQITKNTKGYQAETTCSLDWDLDGGTEHPITLMTQLLQDADQLARREIFSREEEDANEYKRAQQADLDRAGKAQAVLDAR